MARCKTCGEKIIWITTAIGKKMPVNAEQIRFTACPKGREIFIQINGKVERGNIDPRSDKIGYISHFATCKDADIHRKGKSRTEEAEGSQITLYEAEG